MSTGPRRLVVLGDSIAQGWGLAPDERYPALLARMLPADAWQVVNAGQAGDTAIQGALRFGRDVAAQRPDRVLLAFGLNDGAVRRNPSDRWRERLWISRRLGVERCWLRLSRRLPGKERRSPAGRPRTRPRCFRWALVEMVRASRRLGAEVCLVSLSPVDPPRIGEAQWRSYRRYQESIARLAARQGVSFLDLWTTAEPAFAPSAMLAPDGVHLTAAGARWLANRVYRHLIAEGLV